MRVFFRVLFIVSTLTSVAHAQGQYLSKKDFFKANKLTFYGYDYSMFKLYDEDRKGQEVKNYVFNWIHVLIKEIPEEKIEKWLKKDEVVFDFDPTMKNNRRLEANSLISSTGNYKIPNDSIQSIVSDFDLKEKEGIGLVVMLECFNRPMKTVTAYFVFFDKGTKDIIESYYASSFDSNRYNWLKDWGPAQYINFKSEFVSVYRKERRKYK